MNRPANDPERLSATLALVCEAFGVNMDAIKGRDRLQEHADPRLAFYHTSHRVMRFNPKHISRWFSARTRGAVVHGSKRAGNLLETDRRFRSRVEWVIEQMKQRGIV
jgi:chromosomal replication initiation ATPase DnaA